MNTYLVEYKIEGQEIGLVMKSNLPQAQFETQVLLELSSIGVWEIDVKKCQE